MNGDLRAAIYTRSQGMCDYCGLTVPEDNFAAHHRQLRSRGGVDSMANLVVLHHACHVIVHARPARMTTIGFQVPSWGDPDATPILRHGRTWQLPGDGWTDAEPPEGATA